MSKNKTSKERGKKFWLILGLVILMAGVFQLSSQRSLSFHFVDEEDHIVTASFMNQGLKLYKDLSVNHQPLVYLGSSWLQKTAKPSNLLVLVRWHRLAIWAYALAWGLILVWRFNLIGLLFMGLFEPLKFYLFGNLWLMESLAVYPAVYLLASLLDGLLNKTWPTKQESILVGLSSFLVAFNLVPLWPWLAIVWLVYLIKARDGFKWQLTGLMIPTVILFILVSPMDWFRETINYNVVYAMPRLSEVKTINDWLRIGGFPFLAFGASDSFLATVAAWAFTGLIAGLLIKKEYKMTGLIYGLLVAANLRNKTMGGVFYEGFHLLPWLGMLLMGFLLAVSRAKNRWLTGGLVIWGLILLINKNMPYFWRTNSIDEYYINYSRFDDLRFAVETLTEAGDRLAVLSSESLIYWNAGVRPATRQVVYYPWENDVPKLKNEYEAVFDGESPPEFIYGSNEAELIKDKYKMVNKDGQATELFVRNDRVEKITEKQIEALMTRSFSLINN